MRATVTARQPLAAPLAAYAEKKLQRLERHTSLHGVSLHIDHEEHRVPPCEAEVVIHMLHTRLAVKSEGGTIQEAIDRVVDKADRQVLRRKERASDHRGREDSRGASAPPL